MAASTGAIAAIGSNGQLVDNLNKGDVSYAIVLPGPGSYDPQKDVNGGHILRKVNTAAFQSQRKDMLFSGNLVPGPG